VRESFPPAQDSFAKTANSALCVLPKNPGRRDVRRTMMQNAEPSTHPSSAIRGWYAKKAGRPVASRFEVTGRESQLGPSLPPCRALPLVERLLPSGICAHFRVTRECAAILSIRSAAFDVKRNFCTRYRPQGSRTR